MDKLYLRIDEGTDGTWHASVIEGEGPGSLKSFSSWPSLEEAMHEGRLSITRQLEIRACDHEWEPWPSGYGLICSKCRVYDWPNNPRTRNAWEPRRAIAE